MEWETIYALPILVDKIHKPSKYHPSKILYKYFNIFRHVSHDRYALKDLETIDDDLDHIGIILVRLADENGAFADKHELDMVPALMLFHESRPHQYKGTSINHVDSFWDFYELPLTLQTI